MDYLKRAKEAAKESERAWLTGNDPQSGQTLAHLAIAQALIALVEMLDSVTDLDESGSPSLSVLPGVMTEPDDGSHPQ